MQDEQVVTMEAHNQDGHRPSSVRQTVPWHWGDLGKAVGLIVIGSVLLMAAVMAVLVLTDRVPAETANLAAGPIFLLGIGVYAIVVIAVYLFAVRRHPAPGSTAHAVSGWSALGWRGFETKWIWALPPLLFLQFAGMALVNLLIVAPLVGGDYQNPQIEAITGGSALSVRDLLFLMVLIAVVAPVAEELFFRGMLYPLLRQRWAMWPAILLNGLLFSLIHFLPPLLPGLFIVGVVLAWVRDRSGSLIPGILLHAMQNGIVLWGMYQLASGAVL
ncbi:MAG: CPBP family intramembrane metalloprotease [Caldilineaceae bacterium]|nr:CPBP family intramembrane metalloprotease [Caldilineaceae bacterium]